MRVSGLRSVRWKIGVAFALLPLVVGCGGGTTRTNVAGDVSFAGQPVKYGAVQFVPDTAKGHSGPAGSAEIVDGHFDTAAPGGQGIVPGPHLVRITAYAERPAPTTEDETVVVQQTPPLFNGYELPADVPGGPQSFEVPESARGFDIFNPQRPAGTNVP